MGYSFVYHLWEKQSNVDAYKYLKNVFNREAPVYFQRVTINNFFTYYEGSKPAINFEQGSYIVVLEEDCLNKLSEKKIYLTLYLWAKSHNESIEDVINDIKIAIEEDIDHRSDLYTKSLKLFNLLLKKLPPEISLKYMVEYNDIL